MSNSLQIYGFVCCKNLTIIEYLIINVAINLNWIKSGPFFGLCLPNKTLVHSICLGVSTVIHAATAQC